MTKKNGARQNRKAREPLPPWCNIVEVDAFLQEVFPGDEQYARELLAEAGLETRTGMYPPNVYAIDDNANCQLLSEKEYEERQDTDDRTGVIGRISIAVEAKARLNDKKFGEGSNVFWAARIFENFGLLRFACSIGDVVLIAKYTALVQALITQAELNHVVKIADKYVKDNFVPLYEARQRVNKESHKERVSEWDRWNAIAAPIWAKSPALSKSSMARIVINQLADTADPPAERTVREHLQKPGRA